MVTPQFETKDLLHRLHALEGELQVLRKQVGEQQQETPLPVGEFGVLRFVVNGSDYAVPLESILEIVRYVRLTPLPDVVDVVLGAINVRGEVMPVLDAPYRLVGQSIVPNRKTSILLLQGPTFRFGLAVDAVSVVSNVHSDAVSAPNRHLSQMSCVGGVVTIGRDVVQIIDLGRLLSVHQWHALSERLSENSPSDFAEPQEEK